MNASTDALESDPDLCNVGEGRQESLLERYAHEPETLAKFAGERAEFIMIALEKFTSGGEEMSQVEKRSAGYSVKGKGQYRACKLKGFIGRESFPAFVLSTQPKTGTNNHPMQP